jgi:hypothetical protein
VQSLSTLHGGAGTLPFGLPPAVGPVVPPLPPLPPVLPLGVPALPPVEPPGRLGFDGFSRVHAPAAAMRRLAATAPSRLLKIGRDIVLLRGAKPQASVPANTSTMPRANSAKSAVRDRARERRFTTSGVNVH